MDKAMIRSQISKRKLILEGSLIKAILLLSLPIALTSIIFQLLPNKIDLLMCTSKQPEAVTDALPILNVIKQIVFYLGISLAISSTVIIGNEYGKGNYQKAFVFIRKTVYIVISLSFLLLLLSFLLKDWVVALLISQEKSDYRDVMQRYYLLLMFSGLFLSLNTVFFGLLRITNNTRTIYFTNFLFLFFKVCFNFYFMSYYQEDFALFGLSTVIAIILSTLFLLCCIIQILKKETHIHQANFKNLSNHIDNKFSYFRQIFKFFWPIFLANFVYEIGRLAIMLMISNPNFYAKGTLTHYELGDFLAGFGLQLGFALQEGQILIISTNLGKKNTKRAFQTVFTSLKINFVFGVIYSILIFYSGYGFLRLLGTNLDKINESDLRFCIMMSCISGFFTVVFSGILLKSMMAFKKPLSLIFFNLLRIIIRLPLIYFLRYSYKYKLIGWNIIWNSSGNPHGYGFANLLSNIFVLFLILYYYVNFIKDVKKSDV